VGAWDLRMPGEAWSLHVPSWKGLPRHLLLEPLGARAGPSRAESALDDLSWLCVGSSRGHVGLWDTRFLREVAAFKHPTTPWIEAMALCRAPDSRIGLAPHDAPSPHTATPRAYIASAHHEVALWDLAAGRCLQVLKVVGPEEPEAAISEAPAALGGISQAIRGPGGYGAAAQPSAAVPGRSTSIRCMLSFPVGQLVTAGNDLVVRLWDAATPSKSRAITGQPAWAAESSASGSAPDHSFIRQVTVRTVQGVPVLEEVTRRRAGAAVGNGSEASGGSAHGRLEGALSQIPSNTHHLDRVQDMAWLEAPWNEPYLVTGSRDGCVKVFR
jgi:WD40 repeat protein